MYFCQDMNEIVSESKNNFEKPLLVKLYDGKKKYEYSFATSKTTLTLFNPRISVCLEEAPFKLMSTLNKENKRPSNGLINEAIICCPKSNCHMLPKSLIPFENDMNLIQIFFVIKTLHSIILY